MRRYFKNLDGNKAKDHQNYNIQVMIHCNWNQSEASKMLGINRELLEQN